MMTHTRNRRVRNTNVRIFTVKGVEGYEGIRADKTYNVKISDGRRERTCVKQLVLLKGIPNKKN